MLAKSLAVWLSLAPIRYGEQTFYAIMNKGGSDKFVAVRMGMDDEG